MDTYNVPGAEMMGENVKEKLKKIGKEVRLMPLAKIANPGVVEIGDFCRVQGFRVCLGRPGRQDRRVLRYPAARRGVGRRIARGRRPRLSRARHRAADCRVLARGGPEDGRRAT